MMMNEQQEKMLNNSFGYDCYNGSLEIIDDELLPLSQPNVIFFTVAFTVVFIVGLLSNLLVITVILIKSELRKFTNYFFVNLSFVDIFVLIVCTPTVIQDIHVPDFWIYGKFLCHTSFFIEYCLTCVSSLTIVLISFERYAAITLPLKVKQMFNERKSIIAILLIWLISIILTAPLIHESEFRTYTTNSTNSTQIYHQCHLSLNKFYYAYMIFYSTIIIFIPTIFLTLLYVMIIFKLRLHYRCKLNETSYVSQSKSLIDRSSYNVTIVKNSSGGVRKSTTVDSLKLRSSSKRKSRSSKSLSSNQKRCHLTNSAHSFSDFSLSTEKLRLDRNSSTNRSSLMRKTNRKRFTLIILMVTVAFFCCQLPARIFILWSFGYHDAKNEVNCSEMYDAQYHTQSEKENYIFRNTIAYVTRLVYFLHCISNPIIYNIMSTKFRRAFINLICGSKC